MAQTSADDRWSLAWYAPASCPTEATLASRIATLSGSASSWHGRSSVAIDARVEGDGSRWIAHLRTRFGASRGDRILTGSSCASLAAATAVLVAWMVEDARERPEPIAAPPSRARRERTSHTITTAPTREPDATELPYVTVTPELDALEVAPVESSPPPVELAVVPVVGDATASRGPLDPISSAPPRASIAPSPAQRAVARATPRTEVHYAAAIDGVADYGLLPGITGSMSASFVVRWSAWRVEHGATFRPGLRIPVQGHPAAGGTLWNLAATVRLCRDLVTGRIEVAACAGFDLGAIHGTGDGVTDPTSRTEPWVVTRLDGDLRIPFARVVAARASLGLEVPLVRPEFVIDGIGPVHQLGFLAIRGSVGIEVRF